MRTLDRQTLEDLLLGAAVYGSGGGGEIAEGRALIDDALAQGKVPMLAALEQVADEALICTPYMLGAISPLPLGAAAEFSGLPRAGTPPILAAWRRFEDHLGARFAGAVACELGGSNTAAALYAATMAGVPLIDADPAGRAVPEVTHSTYFLSGLPAAPVVLANAFGEMFLCENLHDDRRVERVARALSIASGNDIAAIDHALPAATLRSALIPGTITAAIAMGRALRTARGNVADAVARTGGGTVAFRGRVAEAGWQTRDGFTLGHVEVAGNDGARYRIAVRNENMAGWLDGEVHASIPDLICLIDETTGQPVTNPDAQEGQLVAVVILPAPGPFTTERGLAAFGPAYAGLDGPWRPAAPRPEVSRRADPRERW